MTRYTIGFDFGTESCRALLVNVNTGAVAGQGMHAYAHGVIDAELAGATLPPDYALQMPNDWIASMAASCRDALKAAHATAEQVVGIGVAFTSCTMLPCRADGTPLCMLEQFASTPLAWPKLWKHHGAKAETDRINEIARQRKEPWLARYGGTIGIEWFFPKVLETLVHAPEVYAATEVWLEAGDWLVWQLIDGGHPHCRAANLVRSTCQAGYKAMWNAAAGYPSREYFAAVHPGMAQVSEKMPGRLMPPGERAGKLHRGLAEKIGLDVGTPVSAAIIDAHAGVPGAGVAVSSALVMVMGTSSCHMMLSDTEKLAPGIAGVVDGGILPGLFAYETGQASVGDAFAWLVESFGLSHADLTTRAALLGPGSGGVLALDWLNGCRTPLMDGRLSGAFVGLTLGTQPAQLYRALMEATAMGVRWIVDTLREAGVAVETFVAAGGLPDKSPLLMQIYADVLGQEIRVAASQHSVALGAAILGALAAGQAVTGHANMEQAILAMAPQSGSKTYRPEPAAQAAYDRLYQLYRNLAAPAGVLAATMRSLRELA